MNCTTITKQVEAMLEKAKIERDGVWGKHASARAARDERATLSGRIEALEEVLKLLAAVT